MFYSETKMLISNNQSEIPMDSYEIKKYISDSKKKTSKKIGTKKKNINHNL